MSSINKTSRTSLINKNNSRHNKNNSRHHHARRNALKGFSQSLNLRVKLRQALPLLLIYSLVIVPLMKSDVFTPRAQAQGVTCSTATLPDRIFQKCPLGARDVEQALEDQAISDALTLYQLPASDRSRLLSEGRSTLRALLFTRFLELIKKPSPTPAEQQALAAIAAPIKQKRVDAATYALAQYQMWKADPCNYVAPTPFHYEAGPVCHNVLAASFGSPIPPAIEEFQQMGAYHVYAGLDGLAAQQAAAETALNLEIIGGATAVGLGTIAGIYAGALSTTLVSVVLPNLLIITQATGTAPAVLVPELTGVFAGGSTIGGAAAIVVIALVIAVTSTINVVNASQLEGKLTQAKIDAQNATINLPQMIDSPNDLQQLYGEFILMTLPEVPHSSAPAATPSDRQFIVREAGSSTTIDSPTITYRDLYNASDVARLSGGWFANGYLGNGYDNSTLSIRYFDWNNKRMTAARSGKQFLLTEDGNPNATRVVDEIQYVDPVDGKNKSARIKFEQMTVTGDPLVRVHCPLNQGDEASVVIGSVAASGDAPGALVVTVNDGASATVNGITVHNLAVNSQYQITASVSIPPAAPVNADFTLKVKNTINQTSSAPFTIKRTELLYQLPDAMPNNINVGAPVTVQLDAGDPLSFCGISTGYSITNGALPNGVALQENTVYGQPCGGTTLPKRCIAGAPTNGGSYTFTLNRNYSNGETESRTYTIKVLGNLADIPSGMTSWWRGENNTDDFTGAHNGSLVGSASFADAQVNRGFKFNGTNGYVALPSDTFDPFSTFSYELWFKTSTRGVILGQQRGTAPYNTPPSATPAIYVATDGKLRVDLFGNVFGNNQPSTISATRVDDNYFHHVAITYAFGPHVEKVYLDGALINTVSNYAQAEPGSAYIYQLGTGYVHDANSNMNGWFNFNGLIDEPTLYNRVLTDAEVSAIYSAGGAGKISVTMIPVQPSARDNNDGAILINARGGTPSLRFSKDNGQTFQETSNFDNLTPGDYHIVVKDGANRLYTRTITLNNPPPTLNLTSSSVNPTCAFTQTGRITLNVTGATGAVEYSLFGGGNRQTSNVFNNLTSGTYDPWVRDVSTDTVYTGQQIVLTDPPLLTVSPTTLPDAVAGQQYSQTFTSNGGTGSRTLTAPSQYLPAGFTATSTASGVTISGTPQQAGTITFYFQIDDANGCTTSRSVNLHVTDNCPAMSLAPSALPVGTAGQAFTDTGITPTGGDAPYLFNVTGLPSGMNYNPNATATTLVINGTPQQAGVYPVTVTATSANGCTRNISYTLVVNRAGNPSGQVLISEARTSGANGPDDEYVELYNNTDAPVDIHGWALTKRGFNCASEPQVVALFPQQPTYIPARGHYLITGSAYSLSAYATSNASLAVSLEDDTNLALFTTNVTSDMTPNRRQDAVAFGTSTGNYCDLLREGNTLPTVSGSTAQYSFVRQIKVEGTGAGKPLDTGDNATDFALVSTDASIINGTQSTLGAPGPQNAASPVLRENVVVPSYVDPLACGSCAPNRVRMGSGNGGTLAIRRHFINGTNAHVTRLRFRVIDITTLGSPDASPSQAQLKVINSSDETVTATLNSVNIKGTTIEAPTQAQSGGLNTSLTVQLPGGGLEAGGSLDLQWVMQVVQNGRFRFFVSVEALP